MRAVEHVFFRIKLDKVDTVCKVVADFDFRSRNC